MKNQPVRPNPLILYFQAVNQPELTLCLFLMDPKALVRKTIKKMKNFVKDVVSSFDVGMGAAQTRFGLIQFATTVKREFSLSKYDTVTKIQTAVDKISYMKGRTNTHLALDEMVINGFAEKNGARPKSEGHPRVAIILTDGQSNEPLKTIVSALKVHDADITVIAVGIGTSVNLKELNIIASDPNCLHLILLSSFTEVDSLKYVIERRTCDGMSSNFLIYCQCHHVQSSQMNINFPILLSTWWSVSII